MFIKKIILLLCLISLASFAKEDPHVTLRHKQQELKHVQIQIHGLQKNIMIQAEHRDELRNALRDIEVAIGEQAKILDKTNHQLALQNAILNSLHNRQILDEQRLTQQKQVLAMQVRSAYMLGQHQYIKLLFNQKNPNQVGRLIKYYDYVNKARIDIIQALDQTILDVLKNQQEIKIHTNKLQSLRLQQLGEADALKQKLGIRQNVLSKVQTSINSKALKLHQLLANKKALQGVVAKVQKEVIAIPKVTLPPFVDLRGKLPWPTQGKIIEAFGTHIEDSQVVNNGVLIAAPTDQKIRAIYPGKVVFANWLRGVGLLIIINHGHGILTLYGHNHSIYKKVGDYVEAGEVIATVGKSGGYADSGLYFQIRRYGKALDPQVWCKKTIT